MLRYVIKSLPSPKLDNYLPDLEQSSVQVNQHVRLLILICRVYIYIGAKFWAG